MNKKYVVVLGAVLVVLVVAAFVVQGYASLVGGGGLTVSFDPVKAVRRGVSVELRVWKNHKLVYEGRDPINDNWLKMVVSGVFGFGTRNPLYPYDISDAKTEHISVYQPLNLIVYLGDGTSVSTSDNTLPGSNVFSYTIGTSQDPFIIKDNGTAYNVTIVTTYTADSSKTLSDAGLVIYYKADSNWYEKTLIVDDSFTSVSLNQGDEISVAWVFIIKYSDPPLVKGFWQLLIEDFLCSEAYGHDMFTTGSNPDAQWNINRKGFASLFLGYVTKDITFNSSLIYEDLQNDMVMSDEVLGNEMSASVGSEEVSVWVSRPVGKSVDSCYGLAYIVRDANSHYYLIAYWHFSTVKSLAPDDVVKVHLDIKFNA